MREWTIEELQRAYANGETTPEEVCSNYLERIEEIDRNGPKVNSVIEINPDALEIARTQSNAQQTGLLHGIPVLIKDNIDTSDRMKTTAGSLALVDAPTPSDAFVVKRLREEGAIILGKTNLSEWANFRSSRSNSGWSSRGGQTRNPYVLDRSPCGSSSGSGAAIAANLAVVAIGTETDGSVTCPSAHNSLVGLKPTMGLVSRTGIIPISASQDTAGPMARTVADAAILLRAMIGADPEDAVTGDAATITTGLADVENDDLDGKRIGIVRDKALESHRNREWLALFNAAVKALGEAGAVIVDPIEMPAMEEVAKNELTVLLYEFKAGLESYLNRRGGDLQSLEDIVRWNNDHADSVLRLFGQEHMNEALECGSLADEKYVTALRESRRLAGEEGLIKLLREENLDALAGFSNGPSWIIDHMVGDYYTGGGMSRAPAVSGAPHLTLPIGYVNSLPVGISLVGAHGADGDLLRMGYTLESRLKARRAPEFIPTLGLR